MESGGPERVYREAIFDLYRRGYSGPGSQSKRDAQLRIDLLRERRVSLGKASSSAADILQGKCVLLAEDNPVNQKVASAMLKRMGAEVVVADNGRLAVEAVSQRRPDAILMDMQMPEMDGLEATRLLRSQEQGDPLIIIALTANAMEGDRQRCIDAGMDDYLSKPIRPPKLIEVLAKYLSE